MSVPIDASGSRLRLLHPLLEPDGKCTAIYDLERTFVIDVPESLQKQLCRALEGKVDENVKVRNWLELEGLLTEHPWQGRRDPPELKLPPVTDVSFDLAGSCNMSCVYCFEDAIHSRTGKMSDETIEASLDFVFRQSRSGEHLTLHFGSGEPLLRFEQLARVIEVANTMAERQRIAVSYELTTNATLVTEEIARFLGSQPINVRVSCDGPPRIHDIFRPMTNGQPSYEKVARGLKLLLASIPDRVTVNSVICGRTRLSDIWRWAASSGLRHLHVIKVGAYDNDTNLHNAELSAFRNDLADICQQMLADLQAGRRPIDYQPVTKVVRRLMIPQPITRFCGVAGSYLGISSSGKVYPCFRHLGLENYRLGDVHGSALDHGRRVEFLKNEAADVDGRPICSECWARYLCGGGCYADSVVYGPEKRAPQQNHCPFWRSEIEAAIRFYGQLRTIDPTLCLRLFGQGTDDHFRFLDRVNCS